MTWRFRVQGVITAMFVLGLLAVTSGASWTDIFYSWTDAAATFFGW